jgi:hypothetical protein
MNVERMMRKQFAMGAALLTLSGCLAKTELTEPTAKPELTLSSVALSVEAYPCLSGPKEENLPCLVKAQVTEPTTLTDGTPIADLQSIRFSWTGDWGTNHFEGDGMLLDSPSPSGGHTHGVKFYISAPKCGTEVVWSRAYAITRSGRRSQDATFKLSVDRRAEPGCPSQP